MDPTIPQRGWVDIEAGADSFTDYARPQLMVESGQVVRDVVDVGSDFAIGDAASLLDRESILGGCSKDYGVYGVANGWKVSPSRRNLGEGKEKKGGVAA